MSDNTGITAKLKTGIWNDNPGLVQLLGLCPLLAVTTTFVNGLGLGLATLLVLTFSNVLVSATRKLIRADIRIPMYVLIIASLVTCIEMIVLAWFPSLGRSLGIFHSPDRDELHDRCSGRGICIAQQRCVQPAGWRRDGKWFRAAPDRDRYIS